MMDHDGGPFCKPEACWDTGGEGQAESHPRLWGSVHRKATICWGEICPNTHVPFGNHAPRGLFKDWCDKKKDTREIDMHTYHTHVWLHKHTHTQGCAHAHAIKRSARHMRVCLSEPHRALLKGNTHRLHKWCVHSTTDEHMILYSTFTVRLIVLSCLTLWLSI